MVLSGNTKLALGLLSIALLIGLGIAKRHYFDESRYYFNGQLFGVGKDWIEIVAPQPITCDSHYQGIVLTILTPHQIETECDGCPKIKLSDGRFVDIECMLVTEDGQEYSLQPAGFILGTAEPIFAERNIELTKEKTRQYRTVKLRSASEIVCSAVRMECRNPPIFE